MLNAFILALFIGLVAVGLITLGLKLGDNQEFSNSDYPWLLGAVAIFALVVAPFPASMPLLSWVCVSVSTFAFAAAGRALNSRFMDPAARAELQQSKEEDALWRSRQAAIAAGRLKLVYLRITADNAAQAAMIAGSLPGLTFGTDDLDLGRLRRSSSSGNFFIRGYASLPITDPRVQILS